MNPSRCNPQITHTKSLSINTMKRSFSLYLLVKRNELLINTIQINFKIAMIPRMPNFKKHISRD